MGWWMVQIMNDTFVFFFFAANGFRLPKCSLECSPNSCLHCSHSLLRFLCKWQLLQKRFCGGFRQLLFTFVSQMAVASQKFFGGFHQVCFTFPIYCISQSPPGVKVASKSWHVSPIQSSNPQKRPIMSLLLGYSLGLFSAQFLVVGPYLWLVYGPILQPSRIWTPSLEGRCFIFWGDDGKYEMTSCLNVPKETNTCVVGFCLVSLKHILLQSCFNPKTFFRHADF